MQSTASTRKPTPIQEHIGFSVCGKCGDCAVSRTYTLDIPPVVIGAIRDDMAQTAAKHPLDIPLLVVGVMAIAAVAVGVQHLMAGQYIAAGVLAVWTVAVFAIGFVIARSLCTCERPPQAGATPPGAASEHHRAS